MKSFSVIFYETPNGEQPAKLFLNELSEKQRAKTIRDLKLLETCGNPLEMRLNWRWSINKIILKGTHNMETLDQYLAEQLKNPKFKKEWDELEDEYQIIENIVKARIEAHMTQTQLSEVTGITQSDISKIENGNGNPSLKTLRKIAHAFGKKLKIEFV